MSKSILVINTPCSCVLCPLSFYSAILQEYQCKGREYYRTITDYEWQKKQGCMKDTKPDWCPLLPLPKKLDKVETWRKDYVYLSSYREG